MKGIPSVTTDDKISDIHKVAHLYYMQDLTMDAIARDMKTSRSTVSRLLSRARETGIVTIQVRLPTDEITGFQHAIKSRYGVRAHIVPVPGRVSDVDVIDRVSASAARMLNQYFDSNMTLGIAWGATTSSISRHLSAKDLHNTEVVQLNGAGNTQSSGNDFASDIIQRFAVAYGSRVHQFPVPAFFDSPDTKRAMWQERSVRRLLDLHSRLDIALFGIGSPRSKVPSQVYRGDYLEKQDYSALAQSGVVGDIATVFYRADGSHLDIPLNARSTGPDFEVLRKIPRRICVVAGRTKLLALRGALKAEIITDLVIDEPTANWLARDV